MAGVAGGDPDRQMAEQNTILRALVGSEASGLSRGESSDRDEQGVVLEPLDRFGGFSEFEQYIYRSAAEREGKHDAPSQPGDLDLKLYSLKKFLRLAMQGNPDVLMLLFLKNPMVLTEAGKELQEMAPLIVSRQAGKRYLGYMESQRMRLLGEKGQKKVNRPELEEKYGYDTKYAMHILRLGFQGVELLSTGRLVLPMAEPERSLVMAVRSGEVPLHDMLTKAGDLERELKDLLDSSGLPEHPARKPLEDWMLGTYWDSWYARQLQIRNA